MKIPPLIIFSHNSGAWFFYGTEVKRRPRSFASARFSLTMTLKIADYRFVTFKNRNLQSKLTRKIF